MLLVPVPSDSRLIVAVPLLAPAVLVSALPRPHHQICAVGLLRSQQAERTTRRSITRLAANDGVQVSENVSFAAVF